MSRLLRFWWIGFLLSLAVVLFIPMFSSIVDLKIHQAFSDIAVYKAALTGFQVKNHRYPTTAEGLGVLSPEFIPRISRDPWGNAYVYRVKQPETFSLYSVGIDGVDESGAGDDVTTPRKKYNRAAYGLASPTDAPHLIGYTAFLLLVASALAGLWRAAAQVRQKFGRPRSPHVD